MDLRAKKSLGQNFLKSRSVINTMIDAGRVDSHDIVVEAGPGKGILTEALLACTRQVIAVEKDSRLTFFLSLKFKKEIAEKKLELSEGTILEFNPEHEDLKPRGFKVVSNIPYYLTGQFLRYFLSHSYHPSTMVILVQKEVAKRIVARDKKESILSIAVKAYGTPIYVETVSAKLFSPQPKVDSAILLIENISHNFFSTIDELRFFEVVKAGFSQKRKKLSSNLTTLVPKEIVQTAFKKMNISENIRAEDVTLAQWKTIARALSA